MNIYQLCVIFVLIFSLLKTIVLLCTDSSSINEAVKIQLDNLKQFNIGTESLNAEYHVRKACEFARKLQTIFDCQQVESELQRLSLDQMKIIAPRVRLQIFQ